MSPTRSLRLLAYTDSSGVGGAEMALCHLLGALDQEIDVGVLVTDPRVAETVTAHRPDADLVTIRPPRGTHDGASLIEHRHAIRAFAPDVVHCSQAWPWACAYGEVAGLLTTGARVIAVDQLPVSGSIPRPRRVGRRLLARSLHAHVAVGHRSARLVEELVGLPRGSVRSVPNGVPPDSSSPAPERLSTPVVGSLGRLTEQKGYDLLVRSLPSLPDTTLVLVGDGPQRGELQELASELGVADRLQITGWVADARRYMATFDVFALPSRWEGMPLSILEAMHAGLPVVASGVGSVAEAVGDGDTGYVVPVNDLGSLTDRLRRLLADRSLRERMGERGRLVARESFTDTIMARRFEVIYSAMVGWWRPAVVA